MNGSYPNKYSGFSRGLLSGAQLGMQFAQIRRQSNELKRQKDVNALDAQFKLLEYQLPYLSDEQINKRLSNVTERFNKVYGTKFALGDMEFRGRSKEAAKEFIKIENDVLNKKITNRAQLEAKFAQIQQKYPRSGAYIEKRQKGITAGFKDLTERKRRTDDMILKMQKGYEIEGVSPEGPRPEGLLPPGAPRQQLQPGGGLLDIGGYQWKRRPEEPTTKRVWDNQIKQHVQKTQAQINADPSRYGMKEETILKHRKAGAPQITIGEKAKQRAEATIKYDPKWKNQIVQQLKAKDPEWQYGTSRDKKLSIRQEANTRIKEIWPNAVFDKKNGVLGWYDNDKLIRRWVD